jgi:Uma2 family endonuclease
MAVQITLQMSVAEFDEWVLRPENIERLYEYIGGEVVEVPSKPYVSKIAGRILTLIGVYLMTHDIGHVTGEAGGYMVSGERYAPDVAFISYARQPELAQSGYNPNPPELAVEVVSNSASREEQQTLRRKITGYLGAGVVVWVVDPASRTVEVHRPGAAAQVLDENATLEGGDILPDFKLLVKDIFLQQQ